MERLVCGGDIHRWKPVQGTKRREVFWNYIEETDRRQFMYSFIGILANHSSFWLARALPCCPYLPLKFAAFWNSSCICHELNFPHLIIYACVYICFSYHVCGLHLVREARTCIYLIQLLLTKNLFCNFSTTNATCSKLCIIHSIFLFIKGVLLLVQNGTSENKNWLFRILHSITADLP